MVVCRDCCRIQTAASRCIECGGGHVDAWPDAIERLQRRQTVGLRLQWEPNGWGVVGQIVPMVALVPMAIAGALLGTDLGGQVGGTIGLIVGLIVGPLGPYGLQFLRLRLKRRLSLVVRPRRALPSGKEKVAGVVRLYQQTLPSLLSATPCVASAVIARFDGEDVCERVESADFWLDGDSSILICGAMKLVGPSSNSAPGEWAAARAALAIGDARLSDAPVSVNEVRVAVGARVVVEGSLGEEAVADLGYRGGAARVMRGRPGAPVVVRLKG